MLAGSDRALRQPMPWQLLPLLPLGILAGLLSGLLGIGGGLVFSPLLLALGLSPHQALATSTLAIVPTTLAGSWAHLRSGQLPMPAVTAIGTGAVGGGLLFSHSGNAVEGWLLLGLQALMYGVLAVLVVNPSRGEPAQTRQANPAPLLWLSGVGLVAGAAGGLLGLGGGLVMVPLMVRGLQLPVHLAIRLSTVAVCAAATSASVGFLSDGRGVPAMGLLLGGVAAASAQWSASRLQRVSEQRLVWLLQLLCAGLALDSGRRALQLLLAG